MPRIGHFEIYADDVDRASKFYSDVLGWETERWNGPAQMDYRFAVTGREGPGIDGGITGRPPEGVAGINYVDVESIDEYMPKVEASGGSVFQPKMPIPGVGFIAICKDTEGTMFGFFQSDESAAY